MRRAIENVQRERELYHEIILQYLEVRLCLLKPCPLHEAHAQLVTQHAPQLLKACSC